MAGHGRRERKKFHRFSTWLTRKSHLPPISLPESAERGFLMELFPIQRPEFQHFHIIHARFQVSFGNLSLLLYRIRHRRPSRQHRAPIGDSTDFPSRFHPRTIPSAIRHKWLIPLEMSSKLCSFLWSLKTNKRQKSTRCCIEHKAEDLCPCCMGNLKFLVSRFRMHFRRVGARGLLNWMKHRCLVRSQRRRPAICRTI